MLMLMVAMTSMLALYTEQQKLSAQLMAVQAAEAEKAKEVIEACTVIDGGETQLILSNPSSLTAKVSYVVVKGDEGPMVIPVEAEVPPGGNVTVKLPIPPSKLSSSSIKVLSGRGNVFTVNPRALKSSKQQKEAKSPPTWPQEAVYLIREGTSNYLLDVGSEVVALAYKVASPSEGEGWKLETLTLSGKKLYTLDLPGWAGDVRVMGGGYVLCAGQGWIMKVSPTGEVCWLVRLDGGFAGFTSTHKVVYVLMYYDKSSGSWSTGYRYWREYHVKVLSYDDGSQLTAYHLVDTGYGSNEPFNFDVEGEVCVIHVKDEVDVFVEDRLIAELRGVTTGGLDLTHGCVLTMQLEGSAAKIKAYDLSLSHVLLNVTLPRQTNHPTVKGVLIGSCVDSIYAVVTEGYYHQYLGWQLWYYLFSVDWNGQVKWVISLDTWCPTKLNAYFKGVAIHGSGRLQAYTADGGSLLSLEVDAASLAGGVTVYVKEGRLHVTKLPLGRNDPTVFTADRDEVHLKAGGSAKELTLNVFSLEDYDGEVEIVAAAPPGLTVSVNPNGGTLPLTFKLTLTANETLEAGSYWVTLACLIDGCVAGGDTIKAMVSTQPSLDLRARVFTGPSEGLALSTSYGYTCIDGSISWSPSTYSSESSGYGSWIYKYKVEGPLIGPLCVKFSHSDDYTGPSGKWVKQVCVLSEDLWQVAWQQDLVDEDSATYIEVELGELTGEVNVAFRLLSSSPSSWAASWSWSKPPYIYVKDKVRVEGLRSGETVRLYDAATNELIGQATCPDGQSSVVIETTPSSLSPCRRCYFEFQLLDGSTWTSPSVTVYGGDVWELVN